MNEVKSKEVPLLFKSQMVQALLRKLNPKTVTRRILNPQPRCVAENITLPYQVGDVIWVKETFVNLQKVTSENGHVGAYMGYLYAADCFEYFGALDDPERIDVSTVKWTPSLFMTRDASRINLDVLDVHGERLQDITEESALAEGFIKLPDGRVVEYEGAEAFGIHWPNAIAAYRALWNDINLIPSPINENKQVVSYVSYPWSFADFDAEYPGVRTSGKWRSKPLKVIENPIVIVTTFKRKGSRS